MGPGRGGGGGGGVWHERRSANPGVFDQYPGQRVSISFPGINPEIPGGLAGLLSLLASGSELTELT